MNLIDILIVLAYLGFVIYLGIRFANSNKDSDDFSVAHGKIPTWALGLSFYATFLSAITFLGDPGRAFSGNWNAFAFSLSIPLAALIATRFFIPFYKKLNTPSAYAHLEGRFGRWATLYPMICFILTQLARMGTIFFAMALVIHSFTGYGIAPVMTIIGISIILYSFMGGIQAIIWTEVVQSIIKTIGALVILGIIIHEINLKEILEIAENNDKFSLGGFELDFSKSGFWTVFLYGLFINLTNFGVDQNYIQRYHTARNHKEAKKSVWAVAYYYIPVSFLFFFIGTALYAFYQSHSNELEPLIQEYGEKGIGDKILPHFIQNHVPIGLTGLIMAALLSAGMSAISNGINSSATILLNDFIGKRDRSPSENLKIIRLCSLVVGIIGLGFGLAMIGIKSILETWWILSGIFASGMLGLFLIAFLYRKLSKFWAIISTVVGLIVVGYLSLLNYFPEEYSLKLDQKMAIILGTISMIFVGWIGNNFTLKNVKKKK